MPDQHARQSKWGAVLGAVDVLYGQFNRLRRWLCPRELFFVDGLGDLQLLADYENVLEQVVSGAVPLPPIQGVEWLRTVDAASEAAMKAGDAVVETARFETPFPAFLPEESRYGHIQVMLRCCCEECCFNARRSSVLPAFQSRRSDASSCTCR